MAAVSTPCIQVCELGEDERCIGCGRSLAELAAWTRMTEAERRRVMQRLQAEGYPRRAVATD